MLALVRFGEVKETSTYWGGMVDVEARVEHDEPEHDDDPDEDLTSVGGSASGIIALLVVCIGPGRWCVSRSGCPVPMLIHLRVHLCSQED